MEIPWSGGDIETRAFNVSISFAMKCFRLCFGMFWNGTGILQVVQLDEPFQQVKKILPFTGEFSIGAPVEQACCWA